jgi:hypothetical protein
MTDLSQVWGQLVGRSEWHDQDLKICEWFFDAATKLELTGKIAPAAAEQARAYLAAHVLKEHIYESPKVYRALRKEDSDGDNIIDMLRNKIGGDRDESSGATDERRKQSFALLAQTAADVGLHEGAVDMATYRQIMAAAAPDELRAVDQQMLKRPKDDGPRELDDEWLAPANEEGVNATATELWLRRQGVGSGDLLTSEERHVSTASVCRCRQRARACAAARGRTERRCDPPAPSQS